MGNGIEAGVIAGKPVIFARNRLAIVVPADNPAGISSPADLAGDGVQLVMAADTVPVGQYARESICLMSADVSTYGDDFADRVASNIVSNETNVRNVLTKVQLGEADAGIVYVTDVTPAIADEVTLIDIPEPVNRIASYPIAPVVDGNQESATAFISYVLNSAGQATLAEFGFQAP
jgi:molybdate transport system substrate-binding protein